MSLTKTLIHQIVGYDPETEKLVFEADIPSDAWNYVKSILDDADGDPDYLYIYKLDRAKATDILGLVRVAKPKGLNYYIECHAQ